MCSIDYCGVVSVTIGWQRVRTLIKTTTFFKYFVGSGANPVHTHVVVKSLGEVNLFIKTVVLVATNLHSINCYYCS